MSNTTLWTVQLRYDETSKLYYVFVTDKDTPGAVRSMKIRTITANAAARKYIRDNLSAHIYSLEDPSNKHADLFEVTGYRKPSENRKHAKKLTKACMDYTSTGKIKVVIDKCQKS